MTHGIRYPKEKVKENHHIIIFDTNTRKENLHFLRRSKPKLNSVAS